MPRLGRITSGSRSDPPRDVLNQASSARGSCKHHLDFAFGNDQRRRNPAYRRCCKSKCLRRSNAWRIRLTGKSGQMVRRPAPARTMDTEHRPPRRTQVPVCERDAVKLPGQPSHRSVRTGTICRPSGQSADAFDAPRNSRISNPSAYSMTNRWASADVSKICGATSRRDKASPSFRRIKALVV